MIAETATEEPIPAWLPSGVLHAIGEDAGGSDPARAADYASVDPERVRRAIDRADDILSAHRCFGDDDVIDVALARAALLIARALIRPWTGDTDGR